MSSTRADHQSEILDHLSLQFQLNSLLEDHHLEEHPTTAHHQCISNKELYIIMNQETSHQQEDNCSEKKQSKAIEDLMLRAHQLEMSHQLANQNNEQIYSVVTHITDA